mgnify:CR=1 FL=1
MQLAPFLMSSSMKDFLDKFFDLCREYQEEIPPQKMAEILRDYADRLDGWKSQKKNLDYISKF